MILKYLNYENLNIEDEHNKIENCKKAEIILKPDSKECLFILGMLFVNGVKIQILNEKDLNLEETNKSFSMMPYVWSKLGDETFPKPDYSNVVSEMDKRIENIKRIGAKLNKIIDNPIDKKIFLICPVRNATEKQRKWIEDFVSKKYKEGYTIHAPHLNTRQTDLFGGYSICVQNAQAVASCEEINIYYDKKSTGSVFDLGVAYALKKPLKLLNKEEIIFNKDDFVDSIIKEWPYKKSFKNTKELKELLKLSWSKETCIKTLSDSWKNENPSLGQCAITALLVNDFFGGDIMRCMTSTGSHYYNIINNEIIDLTKEQFLGEIPKYEEGELRTREYLLENEDTKKRYEKLLYNLRLTIKQINKEKFKLINKNGKEYLSDIPGTLGGHKKLKIYGKLDCPSAKSWIEKGQYTPYRVFFENEEVAIAAGYRPCAKCMPKEYREWKENNNQKKLILTK